jgi:hypothetical protein
MMAASPLGIDHLDFEPEPTCARCARPADFYVRGSRHVVHCGGRSVVGPQCRACRAEMAQELRTCHCGAVVRGDELFEIVRVLR